jgi:fibronectin-binding autotransporter adhesin
VAGVADGELRGPISGGNAGIIFQFIKEGAGTWTLFATNSINGSTLVNAGTLALGDTGRITGSTNLSVAAGAVLDVSAVSGGFVLADNQTLLGAGTVNGAVTTTAGSRIRPGGPGTPGTAHIRGRSDHERRHHEPPRSGRCHLARRCQ